MFVYFRKLNVDNGRSRYGNYAGSVATTEIVEPMTVCVSKLSVNRGRSHIYNYNRHYTNTIYQFCAQTLSLSYNNVHLLNYVGPNHLLPSRKCFIMALAKFKTSIHLFNEVTD